MPTKGYDDADNIARVRSLMATAEMTRRQAIITVVGTQNLRRIEMKMRRLETAMAADPDGDPESFRRRAIAAGHALLFPARLHEDEAGIVFEAIAPDPGPSKFPDGSPFEDPKTRFVFHACAGRVEGHAVGSAMVRPMRIGRPAREDGHVFARRETAAAGLDALGLSHEIHDGMIVPRLGTSEMLHRLATALALAWAEGPSPATGLQPLPDEDLYLLAVETERMRLSRSGLERMHGLFDERAMWIAATLADPLMEDWARYAEDKLEDGPGLRLIGALVPFLHGCLYNLGPEQAARYEGRPRDLLAKHLRDWVAPHVDSPTGGRLSDAEIDWLFRVFGNKPIPPLGSFAIRLLLSQRHAIDEARASSAFDAAGLAAIFHGLVERDPDRVHRSSDWVLRADAAFVMRRLNDGPDAALGYGEIAAGLRTAGTERADRGYGDARGEGAKPVEPLHRALRWVLRARDLPFLVLDRLVMPAIASALSESSGLAPAVAESRIQGMRKWSYEVFADRVMELARDMTVSGHDLSALARQGREAERRNLSGAPGTTRYSGIVRSCPIGEACGYEWHHRPAIDHAWDALAPILGRRWRFNGVDLVRVAMADWIRRAGEPDADSARSIRELVARLWPARILGRRANA